MKRELREQIQEMEDAASHLSYLLKEAWLRSNETEDDESQAYGNREAREKIEEASLVVHGLTHGMGRLATGLGMRKDD